MEAFLWCAPEFLLLNKLHFFSLRPKPPWSNWIVCCSPRVRWHQIRSLVSPCYYLPLHQHHHQHHHHHHQNDNRELKSVPMQLLLLEIFLQNSIKDFKCALIREEIPSSLSLRWNMAGNWNRSLTVNSRFSQHNVCSFKFSNYDLSLACHFTNWVGSDGLSRKKIRHFKS